MAERMIGGKRESNFLARHNKTNGIGYRFAKFYYATSF
jgi:hypothetical protein